MSKYLVDASSSGYWTLIFFMFASWGAGRAFAGLTGLTESDGKRRFFISTALGVNICGILIYAASFCGEADYLISYSLLGIFAVCGLYFAVKDKYSAKIRPDGYMFFWGLLILFISSSALSYPVGWDELVYHISLPLRWQEAGFPAVFADNPYSGFPSMVEIIFWKLIWAGGIKVPRMLCFSVTAFSFFGFYLMLRPGLSRFKASAMVFALAVSETMLMLWRETYVESFILLNTLAAFMLIMRGKRKSLAAIALLAGCCGAIKLTGLAAAFVILAVWSVDFLRRERNFFKFVKYAALFGLVSGAVSLIFYLRPLILTGNPCYPYFASYFGGSESAGLASDFHYLSGSLKYGIKGITGFFTIPLTSALVSDAFDGSFGFQGVMLWLVLLFSGFLLIRRRECLSKKALILVLPAFLTYVLWFFSSQQMRFLAVFPFLCALVFKYELKPLHSQTLRLAAVLGLAGLALASIPPGAVKHFVNCWRPAAPANYIYSSTGEGYLQSVDMVRQLVGKNSRYLILFERRGLYYPGHYELGTPFFQEKYFTPMPRSADEMMKILRDNKFAYLLVGLPRKHPDRLPGYEEKMACMYYYIGEAARKKELEALWSYEGYVLYKVN